VPKHLIDLQDIAHSITAEIVVFLRQLTGGRADILGAKFKLPKSTSGFRGQSGSQFHAAENIEF
jgi:hypothetical protein